MIYLVVFVVLVLACARLIRIFNVDEVATPLRSWVINKAEAKHGRWWLFLEALVRCFWCSGFWVSLLVTSYAAGMAAWLTPVTLLQAAAATPVVALAVAYAAPWVLDKEGV